MKSSQSRRRFLTHSAALLSAGIAAGDSGLMSPVTAAAERSKDSDACPAVCSAAAHTVERKAMIAVTLDLEMSANFPTWESTHWNYEKGNLDEATRKYAVDAGQRVRAAGGHIHYFCVGRVLEQPDAEWLKSLAEDGHPIGNHTYDHVNVLAEKPTDLQFRFQRAPWLIEGLSTEQAIRENIRLTTHALRHRTGIENSGFRTPGGFADGLSGREDVQRILLESGFRWVSSKYPPHANSQPGQQPTQDVYDNIIARQKDAQPFVYPTGLIEIPMSPISDIGAFRTGRWELKWFREAVRQCVLHAVEHRTVFDFLAHPSCLGVVDPEFEIIDMICTLVRDAGDAASLVTLDDIADMTASEV